MNNKGFYVKDVTPILRIFDVEKAKAFYLNFLEFALDWEHRYEENFPLYMQVSLGSCKLHLSEHYGDSSPGVKIRIEVEAIHVLQETLLLKEDKYCRPDFEEAHGQLEMTITDPFGNQICFFEPLQELKK
ncbi:VOC family protein [Fictibacillus nanhaiensis]|uniref:glyoxalase superfamily protein n=1 Tax=Fictibacillus nanhaiensis TaxID=742169 RepID=UPI001C9396AD|nr:glyoxalase superfamily protein [Fictibacillus nanhaiensis]MBY6036573.1 VOC family protein [Fictibacillus nanhaiensis]